MANATPFALIRKTAMVFAKKNDRQKEQTNMDGSQTTARPGEIYGFDQPFPIRPPVAVFSKPRADIAPEKTAGIPVAFTDTPEDFTDEFRGMARPGRAAIESCALSTVDTPHTQSGAWGVRIGADHVYLFNQRHAKPNPTATFKYDTPADLQTTFVEQVTFRFGKKVWAEWAPELFLRCEYWVAQNHWSTRLGQLDPLAIALHGYPGQDGPLDGQRPLPVGEALREARTRPEAPTQVVTTEGLGAANHSPFFALLLALGPELRKNSSLAYGWRYRLEGVSVQLYDENRVSLSRTWGADPAIALLARNEMLRTVEKLGSYRNTDLLEMVARPDRDLVAAIGESKTTLASEDPTRIWDIEGMNWRRVEALTTLFERAIDTTWQRPTHRTGVFNLYAKWLGTVLQHAPRPRDEWVEHLSRLEFAPTVLGSLHGSRYPGMAAKFIALLADLEARRPDLFERLTARMKALGTTEPDFWRNEATSQFGKNLTMAARRQH